MAIRIGFILAFLAGTSGCSMMAGAEPVIVITATYPGANAKVVADTVAAPIEQEVSGVENMVRIESISRNDGSYVARVRFKARTDPKIALVLVQNRVNLAMPQLPDEVRREGVRVIIGKADETEKAVTIALLDKGNLGSDALQEWSASVMKQLAAEDATWKPEALTVETEKQIEVKVDREKCLKAGVALSDAFKTLEAVDKDAKIETFQELIVSSGDIKVPLKTIATIQETTVPVAIYRFNLYPAVRITAEAPKDQSPSKIAAKWVKLAEANQKKGFAVENLTGK
jgi:multidrug efflux pump subunit AcrB